MATDHAARVFAVAARDLVVATAAREAFAVHLEAFARRRATTYAAPPETVDEQTYWPQVAAALAPLAPPETMPMAGLVEAGATLEGGARGLRGLFTATPSEKERRRVQKIAALAARVMAIVAGADDQQTDDERRCTEMALNSFGLTQDELAAIRPAGRLAPSQLEIFGELDARVRRELVRGAWQLCLRGEARTAEVEAVRALAAKLDASDHVDALRAEVEASIARVGDMASLAVELARGVALTMPEEKSRAALEHLVRAAAPHALGEALRARIGSREPARYDAAVVIDRGRRVQAVALAWAALVGTDPVYSHALRLRGELSAAAGAAGAGYETAEALDEVDRFLHQRLRDAATAPAPDPPSPPAAPDAPGAPGAPGAPLGPGPRP